MIAVAVISKSGNPLMPTNPARARILIKRRKATIEKYRPIFTIRLTEREDGNIQPVELKCDAGYIHIGISITSEVREYVNEQRDLLSDEKNRHQDAYKYRGTRRNRLRHRKKRFNNRKGEICRDSFAPSVRNKRDVHVKLIAEYAKVIPISDVYVEIGQFDTQVLKAIEEGKPIPEGEDYQHGEQYGYVTLREATFARDHYRCVVCGRSAITDGVILRIHHVGYLKRDRSNRLSNLATVCTECHTSKNHAPGGRLYDLKPQTKGFASAAFMNAMRYSLVKEVKKAVPGVNVHITFGAATKLAREALHLKKDHANDAYSMGKFHPHLRADFRVFQKRRRNNRILEKFYDSKFIDTRTNAPISGKTLSCNRTNRRTPRNNNSNERVFRGQKLSKGRKSIRKQRYPIQPGDVIIYQGKKYQTEGTHCKGASVLINKKSISVKKVKLLYHQDGWKQIS